MNKEQNSSNLQSEKLNISVIIASVSFQNELKASIQSGIETDYLYDGKNEFSVETYNEEWALQQVIKTLKKHFHITD